LLLTTRNAIYEKNGGIMTTEIVSRPHNAIPTSLKDALQWAPDYHFRKQAILLNLNRGSECYLIAGKLLCDAEKGKDWKHDGSCANNFFTWVERELGLKRTNAQRVMGIYEQMKKFLPENVDLITKIEFSKLALVSQYAKKMDDHSTIEMLHAATNSSTRDLENTLKDVTGCGVSTDSCSHSGDYEVYHRCKTCGKFTRQEGPTLGAGEVCDHAEG
jgi:hypothetical protein